MQLKTITVVAASLALANASFNGTWGDHTKVPVLDSTTAPSATKPTGKPTGWPTKPVDGGETDVADTTAKSETSTTTWSKPTGWPTKPVDGGETDVADSTAESSTTTWADVDLTSSTPVADSTTSTTSEYYWGDASQPVDGGETDVADSTAASSTTWADVDLTSSTPVADTTSASHTWADVDLTTTLTTTVEEVTSTYTKPDGSEETTTLTNTKTITKTVYLTPTGGWSPPSETPVSDDTAPPAGGEGGCGVVTTTVTRVSTVTVPAGETKPTGGQFFSKPPAAATTTPAVETETSTWADVAIPTGAAPSAAPVQGGYMGVVSTWRSKMGLSALAQDSTLQSNAQNAADSSGGQLKHKLNPGSMAQVMAPGDSSDFEKVFVGGWLCEIPSLPGLDGVCAEMSKGWNYAGQTGHAEILTSSKYSKIGCALGDGIWTCDLA